MTEDKNKMVSTDSLGSSSDADLSEESLFREEIDSSEITVSEDNLEILDLVTDENLSSDSLELSDFEESSISEGISLESLSNNKQNKPEVREDLFELVSNKCVRDIFLSKKGISGLWSLDQEPSLTTLKLSEYMLLDPFLHSQEELQYLKNYSQGDNELLSRMASLFTEKEDNFAINGNRQIFSESFIELNLSSGFGLPSSVHQDSSGIIFVGTIKGFCLLYLEANSKRCIAINPDDGLHSKITSISSLKGETRDLMYLSLATLDGSFSLWKLDTTNIKRFLSQELCSCGETSESSGLSNCVSGCYRNQEILQIRPEKMAVTLEETGESQESRGRDDVEAIVGKEKTESKTLEEAEPNPGLSSNLTPRSGLDPAPSSSPDTISNTQSNHTLYQKETLTPKNMGILLNSSPKHIKQGILSHEFIEIRGQDAQTRLALFISDMQGSLYVTLLEKEVRGAESKECGASQSLNSSPWKIQEKIFLYCSEEDFVHQLKSFPPPPVIRGDMNLDPSNQGSSASGIRREVHQMDHCQFYLVAGRRGFSLISMLPHPALCKVVDVVQDLGKRGREIPEREVTGVNLTWLRPSLVSRGSQENRAPARILASVSRFLLTYEIVLFEISNSGEIKIELEISNIWEIFDQVNGIISISENIVGLLVGFRGVYFYQIVNIQKERDFTTKYIRDEKRLSVAGAEVTSKEFEGSNLPKSSRDNLFSGSYLVVKSQSSSLEEFLEQSLVCIHKFGSHNKKLFVVSQTITNDLQETISLFGQSFSHNRSGKTAKVVVLLNDRVILFSMLFKSWIPVLEREFNVNMDQIKSLLYDHAAWGRLICSFVALFEERLPPLQTWINVDRKMVPSIVKNILNSILNNIICLFSKFSVQDFEIYLGQLLGLILDTGVRLELWDYLFEEMIPITRSFASIHASDPVTGEKVLLSDLYLRLLLDRFFRNEIEWGLLERDFLRLVITWYKGQLFGLEQGKIGEIASGSSLETNEKSEALLKDIQYIMIRTLKTGDPDTSSGGNPWLGFVPIFKKYSLWSSYIILYLHSGKDPMELLRRILVQMYEQFCEIVGTQNGVLFAYKGQDMLQSIDLLDLQRQLETNKVIQSFYHFFYSLVFRKSFPAEVCELEDLSEDLELVKLKSDQYRETLIHILDEELVPEKIPFARYNCDILFLVSLKLYFSFLTELRRRKSGLLTLINEASLESNGENNEKMVVWYEKLYLTLENKLEALIYRILELGGSEKQLEEVRSEISVNQMEMRDLESPCRRSGNFAVFSLKKMLGDRNSKLGTSRTYLLGNYLNWVFENIEEYNIKTESEYSAIIGCFFRVVQELEDKKQLSSEISSLVEGMEYHLIMAIIGSNRNNQGVNFLRILLVSAGLDADIDEFSQDGLRDDFSKVEMNQRLSKVLKRLSLFNLSLYFSIQVYDLESMLDMYSKKHFINRDLLRELYIMDEEDNNLLFSLNYILSTIEKGIKLGIFNYNQVLRLIIKYTDLLVKIDSLNTIYLISYILSRCLNEETDSRNENSVLEYSQIIREGLNSKVYRLVLGSLLNPKAFQEKDFQTKELKERSVYKTGNTSERWNELINILLPEFLELYLKERKNSNDSEILEILYFWYHSSSKSDQLLNTPFERLLALCKERGNIYGMLFIHQVFSVNPDLSISNKSETESILNFSVAKFESYLKKTGSLLRDRFSENVFIINARRSNSDETVLFTLVTEEVKTKTSQKIHILWEELREFTVFLFLFCFTNSGSRKGSRFLRLYRDILRSLFVEGERASENHDGKFPTEAAELLCRRNGLKAGQSLDMELKGREVEAVLYYVLANFLLGNSHYLHLAENYSLKFGHLSELFFNSRLNKLFSNPISCYHNFWKPILLLIIREAECEKTSLEQEAHPNFPCRFWRHLALEMMNAKLFVDRCNDEVGQLFQGDLLHIFHSLVGLARKAVVVQLDGDLGEYYYELRDQDERSCFEKKLLDFGLRVTCSYCRKPLSNKERQSSWGQSQMPGSHYSMKVISTGANNPSLKENFFKLLENFGSENRIKVANLDTSEFLGRDFTREDEQESDEQPDFNGLCVFKCGSVFHKRCLLDNSKDKFGGPNSKRDELFRNHRIAGKRSPAPNCLHQYKASF
ncbi:hypothetical protein HWI79_1905 [Cryptosporidium felis]|nr:hypothetical protein HWI79_1905 [Cryptosporidium felis]